MTAYTLRSQRMKVDIYIYTLFSSQPVDPCEKWWTGKACKQILTDKWVFEVEILAVMTLTCVKMKCPFLDRKKTTILYKTDRNGKILDCFLYSNWITELYALTVWRLRISAAKAKAASLIPNEGSRHLTSSRCKIQIRLKFKETRFPWSLERFSPIKLQIMIRLLMSEDSSWTFHLSMPNKWVFSPRIQCNARRAWHNS